MEEENVLLLGALENLLGKGLKRARQNRSFHCPFCHHKKPKLEIKMVADESGNHPWECWVCQKKGRTIRSLLSQLNVSREEAKNILQYVKKGSKVEYTVSDQLRLPAEYQSLYLAPSTSVVAAAVKRYLYRRGLSDDDFVKYHIGYCTEGKYAGRIIIPSFDEDNRLNYFVGRSYESTAFIKYLNPEASKDSIIIFENTINWNEPVILCEGMFDAISLRRNSIPLLGKQISSALMKKLLTSKLEDVYVVLDKDAMKQALDHCEKLLSVGKRVFFLEPTEKDPSEEGFVRITKQLQKLQPLTFSEIVKYRLSW